MRAEAPACPPNARQSRTSTESPSDPAYTEAGQARRSRPDDGDVVDHGRVERPDQAQAAGHLHLARIAQQLSAGTEDDGELAGSDVEAFNEGIGEPRQSPAHLRRVRLAGPRRWQSR